MSFYVWCMYVRVSWEEFTEIGENGCFWEGSWRLGVERKLIFHSMTLLYLLSFLSCACIIYPSVHKHKKSGKGASGPRNQTLPPPGRPWALSSVCSDFLLPLAGHWLCFDCSAAGSGCIHGDFREGLSISSCSLSYCLGQRVMTAVGFQSVLLGP